MLELPKCFELSEVKMAGWGDAGQVAGVGFGTVFIVLITLAVAVLISGAIVHRIGKKAGPKDEES